jgi:hypothetical protein
MSILPELLASPLKQTDATDVKCTKPVFKTESDNTKRLLLLQIQPAK